jgi:hypothetical protein
VRQALTEGIKNAGGGGEIHIGDSKGSRSAAPKRSAT